MKTLALLVISVAAFAQNTPVFPDAVAADTDLPIAKNRARTTLVGTLNSSATTLTVTAASSFTVPTLLSIDSEIIYCGTLVGNVFSGCTRGFDGSTAAAHSNLATVSSTIAAWHFNQLAAEVKAIEGVLSGTSYWGTTPFTLKDASSAKYTWRWNDISTTGAGLYAQYGTASDGVYVLGSYADYAHDMGADGIGTHKADSIVARIVDGDGNLLVGSYVSVGVDESSAWTSGADIAGITKGPMAATWSAYSYKGGSVAAALITANCLAGVTTQVNCRNVTGLEFDLNIETGVTAASRAGILFVAWGGGTVSDDDQNYGLGFDVNGLSAESFHYGIKFGGVAGPSSKQPIKGTAIIAGAGTMESAIDFSLTTFTADAFMLPGFTIGAEGGTLINSPFDSTDGNLKVRSNDNDSAVLGLWTRPSSVTADARSYNIANNNTVVGDLEFLASADNSGVPNVKVFGIKKSGAAQFIDSGSKPTCDSSARHAVWVDSGGAGVADTFEVCNKSAADSYAWRALF
jgi:hypothetical protein